MNLKTRISSMVVDSGFDFNDRVIRCVTEEQVVSVNRSIEARIIQNEREQLSNRNAIENYVMGGSISI